MAEIFSEKTVMADHGDKTRMENEGGLHAPQDDQSTEFARLGIIPVNTTIYRWGGYTYTNAHDALAAAKRGRK